MTLAVVQKKQAQSAVGGLTTISLTLDNPTVAGNQLVAILSAAEVGVTWPTGFVQITPTNQTIGSPPPNTPAVGIAIKATASGSETTITVSWGVAVSLAILDVFELPPATFNAAAALYDTGTPVDFPSVTPTADEVLLLASITSFQGYSITVDPAGWTPEQQIQANNGSNSIIAANYSRDIVSPSGSYSGSVSYASGVTTSACILLFDAIPPPPPDPGIVPGISDPDDVFLVSLEDAFGKNFRVELDGTGQFQFSINRHSPNATAINLARDNIVRFTVPQISDDAIFAGFLEVGDFTLVSSDEEGGETLTFGGRGILAYLERDLAWTTSYVLVTSPTDGYWRFAPVGSPGWSTGNEPGQILKRIIDEMQHASRPQHCMTLLDDSSFTYALDSDGNAWTYTDATNPVWTVAVGEDVLTTAGRLIGTGALEVQMDPEFNLGAYNHYGRDLTGDNFGAGVVRFVKGVNIADTVSRQWNGADVAAYELVIGDSENYIRSEHPDFATMVQKVVSNTFEGTDHGTLEALGEADLIQRTFRSESAVFNIAVRRIGGTETADADGRYLPGPPGTNGDFWVGDLVRLHTGTETVDYDETDVRVAAITIAEDDAGNLVVTPELGSTGGQALGGDVTYGGGVVSPPGGVSGPTSHGALGGRSASDQHPADAVTYDNVTSGLTADDVQAAIDELAATPAVGSLDDLTDVVITSPTTADRLRYDGTNWVNSALIWRQVFALDPTTSNYVPVTAGGEGVIVEA